MPDHFTWLDKVVGKFSSSPLSYYSVCIIRFLLEKKKLVQQEERKFLGECATIESSHLLNSKRSRRKRKLSSDSETPEVLPSKEKVVKVCFSLIVGLKPETPF